MRDLIRDEGGVSYAIGVFLIGVVWLSLLWTFIAMGVNEIVDVQNAALTTSTISEDTQYYFDLAVNIFRSTILFGLAGLVFWGVVRSKNQVETNIQSALPVMGSILIMVILAFVSVVLAFTLGRPHDMIMEGIVTSGLMDIADTSGFSASEPTIISKVMYLSFILPGALGIIIHLLSSVRTVSYTTATNEYSNYYEEMNSGEFE